MRITASSTGSKSTATPCSVQDAVQLSAVLISAASKALKREAQKGEYPIALKPGLY